MVFAIFGVMVCNILRCYADIELHTSGQGKEDISVFLDFSDFVFYIESNSGRAVFIFFDGNHTVGEERRN
jgi:hypothetical protein